jgi:hypothetical protein
VLLTNDTERLRVDTSGNVGIGTSSPNTRLTVSSTGAEGINISADAGATTQSGRLFFSTGTGGQSYVLMNIAGALAFNSGATPASSSGIERARIDDSGNLLVGRTSLRTASGVSSGNTQSSVGFSVTNGANQSGYALDRISFDAGQYYVLNQSSTGVILTNGSTAWAAQSDERLKDIIEPISNAAQKVSSLRAVIGKYKTDEKGKRRSFLIAQDVESVLPEAVSRSKLPQSDDQTEYLNVAYTDVIPLLVASIQELKAELDATKAKVAALEGK